MKFTKYSEKEIHFTALSIVMKNVRKTMPRNSSPEP